MSIEIIDSFTGEYRFLSNFWKCPVQFESVTYPSSEHAYVAAKTLDPELRIRIALLKTPGEVKRFGRKLDLRPDWEEVKFVSMYQIVLDKFTRNNDLAEKLLATGYSTLIEGNHWGDTYWGVCKGVGDNNLGDILMRVRKIIRLRKMVDVAV